VALRGVWNGMPRRQQPRCARQLRGGAWFRPPRPLNVQIGGPPAAKKKHENEESETATAVLVASAEPVIKLLAGEDTGASEIVGALCDRLKKKEKRNGELKVLWRNAQSETAVVEMQLRRQADLQGQCGRYWRQLRKLKEAGRQDTPAVYHDTRQCQK